MVDPVSILVGLLEFILNVLVGIVLDFLLDFLWDLLVELLEAILDAIFDAIDPVALFAFALVVAGVVATLIPIVPGPLLSWIGVVVFWVNSGFSEPGVGWVLVVSVLAAAALFVDYFGGVLSARIGGASTTTALAAVVVGIVLGLVGLGPVGFLVGTGLTVFGLEYYRHENGERAVKSTAVTLGGMLGSAVAQFVLTLVILLLMVWQVVLPMLP